MGKDPKTGKPISVRLGRFGAMAQIGTVEDEEKPQFASLLPSQSLNTITLEEVMDLFKLPRTVGEYNGHPVEVNQGRFGPYVKFNGKTFVSLEDGDDPMTLTFERAGELIAAKEKADAPIYMYAHLILFFLDLILDQGPDIIVSQIVKIIFLVDRYEHTSPSNVGSKTAYTFSNKFLIIHIYMSTCFLLYRS